ncbi:hypothetical protein G6R29_03145 [Fructobacillus sp. M2-14]|uniref:Uncharacterized protein n=1 Tax=Fructobacillus broussonetiae TaxID=2713173 RepID=A0ABS5QZK4_9LACO|nr:hypothetical protein [Fructobacillus broussonetiae]MBS9338629.1 hypothetical protein [Fructobacillus broussonetiae]
MAKPENEKKVSEETTEKQSNKDRVEDVKKTAQESAKNALDSTKKAYDDAKQGNWTNLFETVLLVIIFLIALRVIFGSIFNDAFKYLGDLLMAAVTKSPWPIVFTGFIIYYRDEIRDLLNRLGR